MDREAFDRLVARLEASAARSPLGYKAKVGLLALLGYGYIFTVLAVLAAALGLLGLAALGGKHLYAIGKIAIPLLILAWVILRALWVRLDEPEGRELTAAEAPELFAAIDDMRRKLRGPRVHRVLLTDEYNAAVVQTPRLGLLGWQKNHLILGLPMMQALSPEQFRAVLAHEYGHLAGAHSRFSGWIYRIRKSWQQLMEALDHSGRSNFLFKKFFDWYSPFFAAYTFVLARANEYQADRCASDLVGARHAADALLNFSLKGALLRERFWPQVHARADREAAPSFGPHGEMGTALRGPLAPQEASEWLQSALARKTDTGDTHPCLADRLASLGETARIPEPVRDSAARRYFGAALTPLAGEIDRGWAGAVQESWRERYEHVQKGRAELARLAEQSAKGELALQEAWDLAYWAEEIEGEAAALPLYRALLERAPEESAPQFAVGRLLLGAGDEAGIAHLERAMALNRSRTAGASELIGNFLYYRGREDEARRYFERAGEARQAAAEAEEERASLTTADTFAPHGLDEATIADLREQLRRQPHIVKAWLARKVLKRYPDEDPAYGLAVKTRFWSFAGRKTVRKLCQELSGVGHMYIVLVNAFDDETYRTVGKAVKKAEGALIYER